MRLNNTNVRINNEEIEKKELTLKDCYPVFFGNAFLEYNRSCMINNQKLEMELFYKWEKDLNNLTETALDIKFISPLLRTCSNYYDTGCVKTKLNSLHNFILGGFFGTGLGLLFTPFLLFGLAFSIISSIIFIILIRK